jgi:hypothetical protein
VRGALLLLLLLLLLASSTTIDRIALILKGGACVAGDVPITLALALSTGGTSYLGTAPFPGRLARMFTLSRRSIVVH